MTLGELHYRHSRPTTYWLCTLSTIRNVPSVSNCSQHSFRASRSRTRETLWTNCDWSSRQLMLGLRRSSQIRPFQSFPLQQLREGLTLGRFRSMAKPLCLGIRGFDQLQDCAHSGALDITQSLDLSTIDRSGSHRLNRCAQSHLRAAR